MNYSRPLLLAGLLGLASCQQNGGGSSANLSEPSDNSPSIATVNGNKITQNFFDQYIKAITGGKATSDLSADQRTQALDNLIRAQVVGQQAVKDGIDKVPETSALLELTRLNVLQQAVAEKYLKDKKPTEQELRAEYENQVGSLAKQEYHAKHILVATEPFAQKVVERLQKGEKFEDVAKHESMDSSKDNGGDLGWHVIELVETRDLQPPPYDNVRQRLEQVVQAKKVKAYTDDLMRNAKIEKKLPDEKKADLKPDDKKPG